MSTTTQCKLCILLALLSLFWLAAPRNPLPDLTQAPLVDEHSLTVVLPVVDNNLTGFDDFLVSSIYEIVLVCPPPLVADIRHKLRSLFPLGPKVSLYPWPGQMHPHQASLDVVAQVKTKWVLVLDEHRFSQVSECDRAYLLHPRAVHVPVGPRGFAGSSRVLPSDRSQPVAFLVPPFVASSSLLAKAPSASSSLVWQALGNHVAKWTRSFGGVIIGTDILDPVVCNTTTEFEKQSVDDPDSHDAGSLPISPKGLFIVVFPRKEDLRNFVPAACNLYQQGYTVLAYLYDSTDQVELSGAIDRRTCTIPFFQVSKEGPGFFDWLLSLKSVPDIVIGLDNQDLVSSSFSSILEQPPFLNTTLIRLPRSELPYTEWIGTLTLYELRHWNVPEITISVITNNRPHSLRRLLESIQRTLFYGDKVNIRINMDQTSDPETMHIVQAFEWPHGDVFLHHRVIHGGLLPAVVESWYPHSNDSYGLLLEDDVELSPLSFAWSKMTLLRYKYGHVNPSSKLFGISLYQQKMIELRPTGRQPFDARTLFRSLPLDPSTPYLSQIPCSWGALYFPSPWREFHDYLSLRLSQHVLPIRHTVVPGVRSNKWTKSWKKYFIELVYLRGYVMVYPNYAAYVSFSTNHLEVGSHVRDTGEVYERKKDLFSLPLMPLVAALAEVSGQERLLDLPRGVLPDWERLPVLDLVGEVSSLEAIHKRGEDRRSEMDACVDVALVPSSVRDLLCRVQAL